MEIVSKSSACRREMNCRWQVTSGFQKKIKGGLFLKSGINALIEKIQSMKYAE